MSVVPTFQFSRVVDLSRPLTPGRYSHPWLRYETEVESITRVPENASVDTQWYIVTYVAMSGHAGTHVEAPLHAVRDGASVGDLPVDRFYGEAVILDLSEAPGSAPIDRERLERAARGAGGIRFGDIVFVRFDWDRRVNEANGVMPYPPYPAPEALHWLVEHGIKLLGIDSPGLEVPGSLDLVNHHLLFDHGIPLIESLTNLESLRSSRVYVFAQPLLAYGTDAIPLRVLAFERHV